MARKQLDKPLPDRCQLRENAGAELLLRTGVDELAAELTLHL